MSKRAISIFLASILLIPLALLSLIAPVSLWAQEGPGAPFRTTAGPYEITVSGVPSGLSLGKARFVITVVEAATGRPVPDARVVLLTRHQEEGIEGWGLALNSPEQPERYVAEMNLTESGLWHIGVGITSSLGRVEVEAPPVEVPSSQQYTSGSIVFFVMFLIIIGGVAFLVWRIRRAQRQRQVTDVA